MRSSAVGRTQTVWACGASQEVRQLTGLLGDYLWNEMDATRAFSDSLHRDLAMELENGRLFRLMVKLGASQLPSKQLWGPRLTHSAQRQSDMCPDVLKPRESVD